MGEEGKSVRSPPAEEEGAAEASVMYSLIRLCVIFLCRVSWWRDSGPSLRSKSISLAHRRCLWCADPSSSWPSTSSGWRGSRAPQRLSLVRRRQQLPSASLLLGKGWEKQQIASRGRGTPELPLNQNKPLPRACFYKRPFLWHVLIQVLHGNLACSGSDALPPPCRRRQGRAAELPAALASQRLPVAHGGELRAGDHSAVLLPAEEREALRLRLPGHRHPGLQRQLPLHAVLLPLHQRAGEHCQPNCAASQRKSLRFCGLFRLLWESNWRVNSWVAVGQPGRGRPLTPPLAKSIHFF